MTQHEKILLILRDTGSIGMNSYQWGMKFIQLPVRIKELKEMGYKIITKQNKNRSVNYILITEPEVSPIKHEVKKEEPKMVWDTNTKTGMARLIPAVSQERMFI